MALTTLARARSAAARRLLAGVFLWALCAWAPGAAAQTQEADTADTADTAGTADTAVRRLLWDQQGAWNRGDLEGFMKGYLDSPGLVFTSGGRVQRGWRQVLARYRRTYGSGAEMGRLAFSDLEVHPLGAGAAWALGRWRLELSGGPVGGIFTLVLRRAGGEWRIVHDHTSQDAPEAPEAPADSSGGAGP